MKPIALPSTLGLLLALCLHAAPAQAQTFSRTWVSGSGSDGSLNCDRATPCKTFGVAYDKTNDGGEINCVDQGNGQFTSGAVTITKSITIDCGGQFGWLEGQGPQSAIVINGPGINVRLRNLSIRGQFGGGQGILFSAGNALFVENCTIWNFSGGSGLGIEFIPSAGTAQLYVTDTLVQGNGHPSGFGGGIRILPTGSGSVRATLDRVRVNSNIHGIMADGTGTSGSIVVQVRDSTVSGNAGNGIWVRKAGVVVDRSSMTNNAGYGVLSEFAGALVHLGASTVSGNGGGLGASGGGSLLSYQDNKASGNGFEGGPTGVLAVK